MAAESEATALLAANQRALALHYGADVLEAHGRLENRDLEELSQAVDHTGCGDRLDQGPALSPYLQHVQRKKGEHLQRRYESALLVHQPEPVGVAVKRESGVGVRVSHNPGKLREVVRHRLRLSNPGEGGIAVAVNLLDGRLAASKDGGKVARARAVHCVHDYLQPRAPERLQIKQPAKVLTVGDGRVNALTNAPFEGLFPGKRGGSRSGRDCVYQVLYCAGNLR